VAEIDFIALQAAIQGVIRDQGATPTIPVVREVITRYRRKKDQPLLFGGVRNDQVGSAT
jgi:hypothetical protein